MEKSGYLLKLAVREGNSYNTLSIFNKSATKKFDIEPLRATIKVKASQK